MTTLDKQALEKAKQAYRKNRVSIEDGLEDAIRAYLAALPEARRMWGKRLENGRIHPFMSAEPPSSSRDEWRIPIEIREVRDA